MQNQSRTILGATEYCLQEINGIRNAMRDFGGQDQKMAMIVGGLVITLTSHLLSVCNEVIVESCKAGDPNAKDDLREIQDRFNDFIYRMLEE